MMTNAIASSQRNSPDCGEGDGGGGTGDGKGGQTLGAAGDDVPAVASDRCRWV